jgi:uncharacterized cupin superfamily protein/nucleoside-diphosphate-sugar epimerase
MLETPLVIFGCGWIGSRVARAALAAGRRVRVCARNVARLEPLRELGAEVAHIDAAKPRTLGPALSGLQRPTVLHALPPIAELAGGGAMVRAAESANQVAARCYIYLSSAGLYGDKPDEDWVDEDTAVAHDDPAMTPYSLEESALQTAGYSGLHAVTLRLAAVYGPGRGVRARLRKGDYKLMDQGEHWISRIHVDDLVQVIFAAEQRAPQGSLYMVCDDTPTTQREVAEWLSKRMGLPMPPSVPMYAPGAKRAQHRGRRIKNDRMKRDLQVSLLYPSYVEGELAIEAEETGVPAAPAAPAAPRPPFVKAVAELPNDGGGRYAGSDEVLSIGTDVGTPLGLTRLGVHVERVPPGRRTSWPHAHSHEEEMLYVLEGEPDLWVNGALHRLKPGDAVGFPAGTGVVHTLINNGRADVRVMVVGERRPTEDKLIYPLHPARQTSLPDAERWDDAPKQELGPHDGLPDAARK